MGEAVKRIAVKVSGNCMQPLFCDGDLVWVYQAKKPKFGQVIAFTDESKARMIHRYVEIGKLKLTMGDRVRVPDRKIRRFIGVADIRENLIRRLFFSLRILYVYFFVRKRSRNV